MNSEIERLAKEAGIDLEDYYAIPESDLAKFAALVAEEAIEQMRAVADTYISPANLVYAEARAAIRAKFALSHKTPEAK